MKAITEENAEMMLQAVQKGLTQQTVQVSQNQIKWNQTEKGTSLLSNITFKFVSHVQLNF